MVQAVTNICLISVEGHLHCTFTYGSEHPFKFTMFNDTLSTERYSSLEFLAVTEGRLRAVLGSEPGCSMG